MKNFVISILTAGKTVLKKKAYLVVFLFLIPVIGFLLYLIPVTKIPGNSITFQAKLFGTQDYILLAFLAVLESLLIVMFFYQFHQAQPYKNKQNVSVNKLTRLNGDNLGMFSGMFSTVPAFLFGTKLCPICIAAIFGAFGPGAVLFAMQERTLIFIVSLAILLFSIYSVSKKVNGICKDCLIRRR